MLRTTRTLGVALVASALCGCLGEISAPRPVRSDTCSSPSDFDVPTQALRRMTPEEYVATGRDLLEQPELPLTLPEPSGPIITEQETIALAAAAERLVGTGGHLRHAPCAVDGAHDPACATAFIRAFGKSAFRRPLHPEEVQWLEGVYTRTRNLPDLSPPISFRESLDAVALVVLQAPQYVYHVEEGAEDATAPEGLRRTTGFERAARLSYSLWGTLPDAELIVAAENGMLETAEQVRAQARRLLEDPRAELTVRRFASRWLGLNATTGTPSLDQLTKDGDKFPFDSPGLRRAMREESEALYQRVFFQEQGSFQSLMTTTQAYVNGPLAELYGVSGGPSSAEEFAWVQLDPAQRAGLFTRAAFLAQHSGREYQSPIRRGVHVFREVLCQNLGPPPPDVNNVPFVPGQDGVPLSTRQTTEVKTQGTDCQSCHAQVNPLGYPFENYDAMGGWQTAETGISPDGSPFTVAVDSTVTLPTSSDLAGPVQGPVAMVTRLAQSEQARNCMAEHWFEHVNQRKVTRADHCSLSAAKTRFAETDDMRELVLEVLASASTLYLRPQAQ